MTPSKIQMDQIRSTSATDTGENIRAGSQKKSSLSPAEGLQGASPDATCTCPSGDGSIRHPCPAHPAVEQEGGDERAAFEAAYQTEHAGFMGPLKLDRREDGEYKSEHVGSAWRMWQARAALAQPPVSDPLMFACKSLAQITSSDGSGHADIALAVLRMAGVSTEEREQLVNGWKARRAWSRSPTQAEKAEVERPEVVARVVHSNPVVLDHCGPLNANDELMTVAQHAASVARWAEMFNRVEQERDAALARVAELTATRNRYGLDAHYFNKNLQRILRDFGSFTPDELARSLIILAKVADEKVVAQAQHSVPDELRAICMLVAETGIKYGRGRHRAVAADECRAVVNAVLDADLSVGRACEYAGCCDKAHPGTSLCIAHHSKKAQEKLLAAAPGKEGV
ncbi:TPA: hypothetical protein L4T35_004414 [Pseudomonas aeruginosa]|nr:hypothetical protein [Pseudomonas aeruginosa]